MATSEEEVHILDMDWSAAFDMDSINLPVPAELLFSPPPPPHLFVGTPPQWQGVGTGARVPVGRSMPKSVWQATESPKLC